MLTTEYQTKFYHNEDNSINPDAFMPMGMTIISENYVN
jgi:hypothetical protein